MISRTAEYALRAVVVLGSTPGSPRTTQKIAEQTRVSSGYLSKVLQALGRAVLNSADDMVRLLGAPLTPARLKCGLLAWRTLQRALPAQGETIQIGVKP